MRRHFLSMALVLAALALSVSAALTLTSSPPESSEAAATLLPETEAPFFVQSRLPGAGPDCLVPDANAPGGDRVTCETFETRLRISRVEGNKVWLRYALDDVKCNGYYVVHFWPNGRHNEPVVPFPVGELKVGEGKSGEVGPWEAPAVTKETTFACNIDFDIFGSEDSVKLPTLMKAADMENFIGQCDSGCSFKIPPPNGNGGDKYMCHVGRDEDRILCELYSVSSGLSEHGGHTDDYNGKCTNKYPTCQ